MLSWMRSVPLCFCLLACLASAKPPLTWIMADGASEPYQIVSPNLVLNPHSGVLTDVLREMLVGEDIVLHTEVRPYKRIRIELLAQRYDYWVSYGSPAWLDERVLALGEYSELPVFESRYLLVSRNGSDTLKLGDARGKRLILIHGYTYFPSFHHWVEANKIQLVYAPSHRHALAMLRQHRGDLYLAEELRVYWQAQQLGIELSELQLQDFSSIIPPSQVYFLFDKRIPTATRAHLNQMLAQLAEKGRLEAILAGYR